jgi:hypothetical protein
MLPKKVTLGKEVIINDISCDVDMSELYIATDHLISKGFAGCYAIVAEFKQIKGDKIVGMLGHYEGHYDPSLISLFFERQFPFAVRSLENIHHYRLRKMFVCYKDVSAGEALKDVLEIVKISVSFFDTTFIEYKNTPKTLKKGLVLDYFVQQRYFDFDTKHSFRTGK